MAREAHHWVLATAVMLEGHKEWLSCSTSWGQHGSQRQLGSHWWLRSRRCSRSRGHSRNLRRHLPVSPQGQTPPVEGCPGDAARRQADSSSPVQPRRWVDSPSHVQPRRWVTFEDASSDSSPETTLKLADWSHLVGGDDSPPPSGNLDDTAETVDWTQPVEGDDCLPLSAN